MASDDEQRVVDADAETDHGGDDRRRVLTSMVAASSRMPLLATPRPVSATAIGRPAPTTEPKASTRMNRAATMPISSPCPPWARRPTRGPRRRARPAARRRARVRRRPRAGRGSHQVRVGDRHVVGHVEQDGVAVAGRPGLADGQDVRHGAEPAPRAWSSVGIGRGAAVAVVDDDLGAGEPGGREVLAQLVDADLGAGARDVVVVLGLPPKPDRGRRRPPRRRPRRRSCARGGRQSRGRVGRGGGTW